MRADAGRGQVLRHGQCQVRLVRAAPVGRPVQRDVEAVRVARLRQQLPCPLGVVVVLDFLLLLRAGIAVGAGEREEWILTLADEEVVDDGRAVDRVVRGLADADVQERVRAAVCHRLGVQVGIEDLDAPRSGGLELHGEVGVVHVRLHVIGAQFRHRVDLTGLQAGEPRLDLGPHHDLQVLVVGVVRHHEGVVDRAEVVLEALEDEVRVVFVADEAVGAGAHRRLVHRGVAAPLRVRLRHDDELEGRGQVDGEEARIGRRQLERQSAVVHGLVPDPVQGAAPAGVPGGPAAGVIARLAALVVRGHAAHAVEAEHEVVGADDRAVVERRWHHRRPDRNGVDPLRRGELWDRRAIAGIHRHGRVEDGAVRVEVRDAAGTMLIQAPLVAGDHPDDRGVQIDLVERPGHGELGRAGLVGPDDGGRGGGGQIRVSASGSATMHAMKPARLVRSRPMRCAAPWMART